MSSPLKTVLNCLDSIILCEPERIYIKCNNRSITNDVIADLSNKSIQNNNLVVLSPSLKDSTNFGENSSCTNRQSVITTNELPMQQKPMVSSAIIVEQMTVDISDNNDYQCKAISSQSSVGSIHYEDLTNFLTELFSQSSHSSTSAQETMVLQEQLEVLSSRKSGKISAYYYSDTL